MGDDYAYDTNENLTKGLNKNITDTQYNVLYLPNKVTFVNVNSILYVYAIDGRNLRRCMRLTELPLQRIIYDQII